MAQKNNLDNSLWQFFASVKLALLILFLIAVTSIIGTVIPQREPAEFYLSRYGPELAQLFALLDIPDMYNSWWFLGLLALLGFNLMVCSVDRFPGVWKQIKSDGLTLPLQRLLKMSTSERWRSPAQPAAAEAELTGRLREKGWKVRRRDEDGTTLLFTEKGGWTRIGVYIVHSSILVIFLGAIIGSLLGYKGSVMVPETMARDTVFLFGGEGTRELGFAIRCNRFAIDFYPNGMPREYTSSLTVIENGQEVLTRDIEVNHPLTYKGVTFYQSSYEPYQDFIVSVTTPAGTNETFIAPFQEQVSWEQEEVSFGVLNARARGQAVVSAKLWFSDNDGDPASIWLDNDEPTTVTRPAGDYIVSVKQMYATGLQVARDPGVWWVYAGCTLMLFGLYVAFFMSHRRLWLLISPAAGGSELVLCGSANKNRPGFQRDFATLVDHLQGRTGEAAEPAVVGGAENRR